jgi:twinkle protein
MPRVLTGVDELDRVLGGGIYYGQVCLLSGKRGEGKSTFMSQIFADALNQGLNCFVYSGELRNADFKRCLNSQLAGITFMSKRVNRFNEEEWYLEKAVSERISNWYKGRAFIYDTDSIADDDKIDLLGTIRRVVTQNAVQFVCIDNLMTAMDIYAGETDLYNAQGKFVGELKSIARKYNIAVVLVAHQRKAGKDQQQSDAFDNDTVSGSADVTNKVDIVINYSRAKEEDQHDSNIQVGKNRLVGTLRRGDKAIKMVYSPKTKRVYALRSLDKHYAWEKEPVQVDEIDVPF